jgi:hypothetical protein
MRGLNYVRNLKRWRAVHVKFRIEIDIHRNVVWGEVATSGTRTLDEKHFLLLANAELVS